MNGRSWRIAGVAVLFGLVTLFSARAEDKPMDEGKASDFKGKTYTVKGKDQVSVILDCQSGKQATVTVRSTEKTDVNLFVYHGDKVGKDDKPVAKDDSPGPDCDVKFTPDKSGKYTFVIKNAGADTNKCTLKVEVAK
jgi:hypothetical protein